MSVFSKETDITIEASFSMAFNIAQAKPLKPIKTFLK